MEQKTITIYNFNELSEDAQQNAIDNYRNRDYYDIDLSDVVCDFIENVKDKLGLEFKEEDINYSIMNRNNYAYIDRSIVCKKIQNKYNIYDLDLDIPSNFGVFTNYLGGGLCSGPFKSEIKDDCINFYDYADDDDESEDFKHLVENKINKELILNDLRNLQNEIEKLFKNLYEEYEYQNSDEYIKDILENNNYTFYDNGEFS